MKPFQARQGDILITRIADVPTGATEVKADSKRRFVLAEGEATGHAHRVDELEDGQEVSSHTMFINGETRFLSVGIMTALKHEEHRAIPLEPGVYKFERQREYTPQAIRPVFD